MKKILYSLDRKAVAQLRAGDEIIFSGKLLTARDQAHKRLIQALAWGRKLPLDVRGQLIYYCGPTQTPKGHVIGACGPTTSSRMDAFTPALLKEGALGMIGKGWRSKEVREAIKRYRGIYFLTYAGCGALLAQCVKKADVVAYADLGPEAMFRLVVKDFPLIVGIDAKGNDIYNR